MEVLSVSRSTFLRVADSVTHQVTPRASGVSVRIPSPPAPPRGDHPHFEPSQRGSLQKALEAISTSSGRDGVIQQADSLTTAASTVEDVGGDRDRLGSATASTHADDRSVYVGHVSGGRISFTSEICW